MDLQPSFRNPSKEERLFVGDVNSRNALTDADFCTQGSECSSAVPAPILNARKFLMTFTHRHRKLNPFSKMQMLYMPFIV